MHSINYYTNDLKKSFLLQKEKIYNEIKTLPLGAQEMLKDVTIIQSYVDYRLEPMFKSLLSSLLPSVEQDDETKDENVDVQEIQEKIQEFFFTLATRFLSNQTEEENEKFVDDLLIKFNLNPTIEIDGDIEYTFDFLAEITYPKNETIIKALNKYYDWNKIKPEDHSATQEHLEKTISQFLQLQYSIWIHHMAQRTFPSLLYTTNLDKYFAQEENLSLKQEILQKDIEISNLKLALSKNKDQSFTANFPSKQDKSKKSLCNIL